MMIDGICDYIVGIQERWPVGVETHRDYNQDYEVRSECSSVTLIYVLMGTFRTGLPAYGYGDMTAKLDALEPV